MDSCTLVEIDHHRPVEIQGACIEIQVTREDS